MRTRHSIGTAVLVLLVLALPGCRRGTEVHLIPEGHTGPVAIVYGVPEGVALERSAEGLVYRIPEGGLLLVQDDQPPAGRYRMRYYYVGADGTRTRMRYDPEDGAPQVFAYVNGYSTWPGEDPILWDSYLVGDRASQPDWGDARERLTDKAVATARALRAKRGGAPTR